MERKSRPWKKVFDKIAWPSVTNDPTSREDVIKQGEEVSVSSCPPRGSENIYAPRERIDALDMESQTDAKLRVLAEQLMARDDLVQEHAKVAEEAVLGWEKAELEVVCLRQQLDAVMLERATMEERLMDLDVALKDCMGQVKHAEDSEWKLKEVVAAKEHELERVRLEMESTMSKLVNEMTRTAKEADAKGRAEEKACLLQARVVVAEEEVARWKKEVHVMTKELSMRSEEGELGKKEAAAASKQHLESVKRLARLEGECERLLLLLGKKFLGPATVAQVRMEAGVIPAFFDRSSSSISSPLSQSANGDKELTQFDGHDQLADRLLTLEEENKALRDSLNKKDEELQSARMLCTKTAMKLSAAQEQLERSSNQPRPHHRSTKSAIDGYTPFVEEAFPCDESIGDEITSADLWASSLITELAQLRKDKGGMGTQPSLLMPGTDLMDDFAEMEKLASIPFENQVRLLGYLGQVQGFGHGKDINKEMHKANEDKHHELQTKLSCVENELYTIKLENSALKDALSTIETHLLALLQAETAERTPCNAFGEVSAALDSAYKQLSSFTGSSYASFHGVESPEVRDTSAWSTPGGGSSCLSEEVAAFRPDMTSAPMETHIIAKLCAAVHKVVGLFGELAQVDLASDTSGTLANPSPGKLWRGLQFEACVHSLVELCNGVLDDKVEVHDFLEEVASALEWLVGCVYALPDTTSMETRRRLEFEQSAASAPESRHTTDSGGVLSKVITSRMSAPRVVGVRDENRMGITSKSQGLAQRSKTMSRSLLNSETRPTLTNSFETVLSMERITDYPSALFSATRNEKVVEYLPADLSGYAEKLMECQQVIPFLAKELPKNVSEASPDSDHNFMEPYKAHHRTHKSLERHQSIKCDSGLDQDSQRGEDANQKGHLFEAAVHRDLAMAPSHSRFLKSRINRMGDLPAEKHTTGVSRFFFKPSFH